MHERGAATLSRVRAGEHEGRARHGAAHPERRADPPGEGRLARTELPVEGDEVARAKLVCDPLSELRHLLGRLDP